MSFPWSARSKVRLWLDWLIGESLLGYGERPLRPLMWALGIILLFAAVFWHIGDGQKTLPFQECLYRSSAAFLTFDNDAKSEALRALTVVEGAAGVSLMSLFLVVLARRFVR